MRRPSRQLDLLDLIPTRQPRRIGRETAALYGTVLALRRLHVSVRPEGQGHRVDGALMSTAELYAYARRLGAQRIVKKGVPL
ncbi:hypothetical protein KL86APRO_12554 [uncultured Alphaproteobacteria bacterium]|uniref:Uncharacterized protein n=1 Tax=uncultured Alphaproteobacteria bacterium TaxID=91750 RepID=A0A212KC50_9PROT|nr:hypothetical protein KL86APRO_12554 [uncultured Alphaproteobacteria bacterium]